MSLVSNIVLVAAPVVGGVLLLVAGGQLLSGMNFRAGIRDDVDLLAVLPEDEVDRRAALRQSIVDRVDDLLEAEQRKRELRSAALKHQDSWRDIVMFVSSVLFTAVWWNVDHDRLVWVPLFVMLIATTIVSAVFAWRTLQSGIRRLRRTPGATR